MRTTASLLVLLLEVAGAQTWVQSLDGGSCGSDRAVAVDVTRDGSAYVAATLGRGGYSVAATAKLLPSGSVSWQRVYDPFPGMNQQAKAIAVDPTDAAIVNVASRDSSGVCCYASARYLADGTPSWSARYCYPARRGDFPRAVVALPDGGAVVTGTSVKNSADCDIATVCYSPAGSERWVRRYDGPAGRLDDAGAVLTDADWGTYVAGSAAYDSWCRTGAVAVKYDSVGNVGWLCLTAFPGTSAYATCAARDSAGNTFVAGAVGSHYTDILTVKIDPAGDTMWTRRHYLGGAEALALDPGGYLYVAGTDDQSGASPDIITLKYDGAGNQVWAARFDGVDHLQDWGYGIALGPDHGIYVCGLSQSVGRGNECILIKYRPTGETAWTARIAGDSGLGAAAQAVVVDPTGDVIIAGYRYVAGQGDNYLVAKYPPTGPGVAEEHPYPAPELTRLQVRPTVVRRGCAFELPADGSCARVRVLDLAGRAVRVLAAPTGSSTITWDATDETGSRLPDGVYFALAEGPGFRSSCKFLLHP